MSDTITIKGHEAVSTALKGISRQIPFVMSQTLNYVANEAQRAVKRSLSDRFTLRRKTFVENTIFRGSDDKATKTKFQARIRVHPERNFLGQHEEGGRKTPRSGSHVAIPLPAVQASPSAVIPKRLRPSGLRMNGQVRKVVTPSGTYLVRNLPGKGKGRLEGWRTEFLYALKPSVPVRPRLAMRDTSEKAIDASFVRIALVNIDNSIKTAR